MSRQRIYHALGLHLHQPPGNFDIIRSGAPDEARRILAAYARIGRFAAKYTGATMLNVSVSGTLLEQLGDPALTDAAGVGDSPPDILSMWKRATNIEWLGCGHYHPAFPLIPKSHWADQLRRERETFETVLGKAPKGFMPPHRAIVEEMIPALAEAGYDYAVVPVELLARAEDGEPVDPFSPCMITVGKTSLPLFPTDAALCAMQTNGQTPFELADTLTDRAIHGEPPRLATTWSDGENGPWFRRDGDEDGFFGDFYGLYAEYCEHGEYPSRSVKLSRILEDYPPLQEVVLRPGTHLVDTTKGPDFTSCDPDLRPDLQRLFRLAGIPSERATLELLLQAEGTDCMLGEDIWRRRMGQLLDQAEPQRAPVPSAPQPPPKAKPARRKASAKSPAKPATSSKPKATGKRQ
ncbi:hypothetical protein [Magnetospira sp. QH-2]|uniref:hypothetical protein n=1 Tax=Magnetospira sp. (strain QH-2) TaxID=1288970 RepID=UPI0003E81610|nr:hypothetical protein [Magnetospira sp. QH-2]CCQ73904.1 putative GH57 : distantly related to a-amylase [Magnetospira sp. QH-2]